MILTRLLQTLMLEPTLGQSGKAGRLDRCRKHLFSLASRLGPSNTHRGLMMLVASECRRRQCCVQPWQQVAFPSPARLETETAACFPPRLVLLQASTHRFVREVPAHWHHWAAGFALQQGITAGAVPAKPSTLLFPLPLPLCLRRVLDPVGRVLTAPAGTTPVVHWLVDEVWVTS